MNDMAPGVLAWFAGQPLPWPVALLVLAVALLRPALRHVTFLYGLIVVMRGSAPADRPEILRAYSANWASRPKGMSQVSRRETSRPGQCQEPWRKPRNR